MQQNADATTTITDEKKIAIDKQISDNVCSYIFCSHELPILVFLQVMKGEDDDEWMNEGVRTVYKLYNLNIANYRTMKLLLQE